MLCKQFERSWSPGMPNNRRAYHDDLIGVVAWERCILFQFPIFHVKGFLLLFSICLSTSCQLHRHVTKPEFLENTTYNAQVKRASDVKGKAPYGAEIVGGVRLLSRTIHAHY